LRKDEDIRQCEECGDVCDEQDFLVVAEKHRDDAEVNLAKGVEAVEASTENCAVFWGDKFEADDEGSRVGGGAEEAVEELECSKLCVVSGKYAENSKDSRANRSENEDEFAAISVERGHSKDLSIRAEKMISGQANLMLQKHSEIHAAYHNHPLDLLSFPPHLSDKKPVTM
jgi:hypothetical protein